MRKYYEAYDDRYKQAHEAGLDWFTLDVSRIVQDVLGRFGVEKSSRILELGCGEGRDAMHLLEKGYDLTATDISPEAIRHCREKIPESAERFRVLDAVAGVPQEQYDMVYAIAVLHMLVEDKDRAAFLRFVGNYKNGEHEKFQRYAQITTAREVVIESRGGEDIITCLDGEIVRNKRVVMRLSDKKVNVFGPIGCDPNATCRA